MKRKHISIISLTLAFLIFLLFTSNAIEVMLHLFSRKEVIVVIDAGHGGFDPGKVGINKALEKEINLSIAYKLKRLLEQNDIKVVMTRKDDNGLYQDTDRDKKRVDMNKRVKIINSSNATIAISIHQNSFTQESIKGAQIFYYQNSERGKMLAETIQERVKKTIKDGNHRLAKSNSTYYLLKYATCPLVIVECGFLSNRIEADLLCDENYQEKMAWAIHLGVLEYINKSSLFDEVYLD